MDKHRSDSVGPADLRFTLLDDYLHVVHSALWLSGGEGKLLSGILQANHRGQMLYAEHHFSVGATQVTTSMHRRAGSQGETVVAIDDGVLYRVTDMRDWQYESAGHITLEQAAGWQSMLEQRGFVGVARHFIRCAENQTTPQTSGERALMAQRLVEKLWQDATPG